MGESIALLSAAVWTVTAIAMRPIGAAAVLRASVVRMLVGTIFLASFAIPTGALDRALAVSPQIFGYLIASLVAALVIGDTSFFIASTRIGVARAGPISSAYPMITTLAAIGFGLEQPSWGLLFGTLLVVAGIALVGSERGEHAVSRDRLGVALAVVAALGWGASGLLLRPALEHIDTVAANLIRFPAGVLIFGVLALTRGGGLKVTPRQAALGSIAGVAAVTSSLLYLLGIALAGVARGVALNATAPIFTAIAGFTLFGEKPTRRLWLGVLLCVAGSWLLVV